MSKKENKIKGNVGENIACEFLEKHNFQIIDKNFSCYLGEIDIIAIDKNELVFIEVKTRTQDFFGAPREAVDINKKSHIYNVAQYYLINKNLNDPYVRFDVIEVYLYDSQADYQIKHIKNVITENPFIKKVHHEQD